MKKILQYFNLYPDSTDKKAWLIGFLLLNFAFLYHTLNFMWGNHDVKFIKEELLLSSGLFEGRFTQFIPYRLLTTGQILPILNNLIGFSFLTTALWLLAKYWNIKKTLTSYTLFIAFFTTQPYTLSWLYFSFITISCMLWTLLAILGLYLSSFAVTAKNKIAICFSSIICFYLTLGGYPPIINTFFVCLSGKLVFSILLDGNSIKDLWQTHKFTLFNILIASLLFKLTLKIIAPENVYNLNTEPLLALPSKFISSIKIAFSQFFITVPFMERGYKTAITILSVLATASTLLYAHNFKQKLLICLLLCGTIWATALTTFLAVSHTEYVSRIDFFGVAFLYVFFLGILLTLPVKLSHNLALICAPILIFMNILNDYRALHTWQQGFDAEFQILDNITERIENHPNFSSNRTYRFYQAGDISLRPNYHQKSYDKDDVFLLSLPYLAIWQGANLHEFYTLHEFIDRHLPLLPEDITPEVYDFFMYEARPWPHPNAVFINNDIIIVVYNQNGLTDFRNKLYRLSKDVH